MRLTIDFSTPPALTFTPQTKAEEAIQGIYIVLTTYKGSVPCYRDFGLGMDWMHRPTNAVESAYAVEAVQAIQKYVPGVRVDKVRFKRNINHTDRVYPILEVSIIE